MYALQISRFGEPSDVLELVKLPDPHDPLANEVLVAVEYAPINGSDLLTIRGQYGRLPSLPTGLGFEGVGRILSVGGEVDDLKVGDRVLLPSSSPSWREKVILPSTGLFPLPQNADPQQLSMLSINPPTAALLLSEYVELKPGDWVIQNAGNSGVGRSVIAFAKDRGLRTVSACSGDRRRGAAHVCVIPGTDPRRPVRRWVTPRSSTPRAPRSDKRRTPMTAS